MACRFLSRASSVVATLLLLSKIAVLGLPTDQGPGRSDRSWGKSASNAEADGRDLHLTKRDGKFISLLIAPGWPRGTIRPLACSGFYAHRKGRYERCCIYCTVNLSGAVYCRHCCFNTSLGRL